MFIVIDYFDKCLLGRKFDGIPFEFVMVDVSLGQYLKCQYLCQSIFLEKL